MSRRYRDCKEQRREEPCALHTPSSPPNSAESCHVRYPLDGCFCRRFIALWSGVQPCCSFAVSDKTRQQQASQRRKHHIRMWLRDRAYCQNPETSHQHIRRVHEAMHQPVRMPGTPPGKVQGRVEQQCEPRAQEPDQVCREGLERGEPDGTVSGAQHHERQEADPEQGSRHASFCHPPGRRARRCGTGLAPSRERNHWRRE